MKLEFTARSRSDLLAITEFIARNNPIRAESFLAELEVRCWDLLKTPHIGLPVSGRAGVRRVIHGRYLIFYRAEGECVRILAVLGGEMDLDALLF